MSQQTLLPETMPQKAPAISWRLLLNDHVALSLVLAALLVMFGALAPGFLSLRMLTIMADQVSPNIILAVGMTYVLIIAGIDLSVGWVMTLGAAVLVVSVASWGLPLWMAILAAITVGALCGIANGLLVVIWSLPSFIVTLGMLQCASGLTNLLVRETVSIRASGISWLDDTQFGGFSLTFFVAILVVMLGQFVLSRTIFGRYMVALGTNEEALRLSGVSPWPIKLAVFTICGFLVGVAAVIDTSRTKCADPTSGSGIELEVIAAVVIGGTSLMGGRGSVINSLLGVLILKVVQQGLPGIGVGHAQKLLFTGIILFAAVILDYYRRRLSRRGGS